MGPTFDELIGAGITIVCTLSAALMFDGFISEQVRKARQKLRSPPIQKRFSVLKTAEPSTYYCPACGCQLVFRASYGRHPNSKFFRLWCEVCKTGVDKPIIKLKKEEKS